MPRTRSSRSSTSDPPGDDAQVFRHGWQSWSATGWARLGVDRDPSAAEGSPWLSRAMHHGDATPHPDLRSEWVTVVRTADGLRLIGADATDRHDTTIRLRIDGGTVLAEVVARTGGLPVEPHRIVIRSGDDAEDLLGSWATAVGVAMDARTSAPYRAGWCSWYQYFGDVGEGDIRTNLALATEWPFDLFQVDDGWQPAIGDWSRTRYASDLGTLAADVAAAGFQPGIWLAPFLAAPRRARSRAGGWPCTSRGGRSSAWSTRRGAATSTCSTRPRPEVLSTWSGWRGTSSLPAGPT